MTDEYTPSTEQIRRRASEPRHERYDRRKRIVRDMEAEFDRWLASVKAEVLEELAGEVVPPISVPTPMRRERYVRDDVRIWLLDRAAAYRQGVQ